MKFMKTEGGQSLFELVVAIAISAMIIVAIVSLATNSIKNSNFSRNKTRAASYAQEATEWLRGQRDSNLSTFIANATLTWCLQTLAWSYHSACGASRSITGTPFTRQVTFSATGVIGVIEADVLVTWTDAQGVHEVASSTNFATSK